MDSFFLLPPTNVTVQVTNNGLDVSESFVTLELYPRCEEGSYCPTDLQPLPCPAGAFCAGTTNANFNRAVFKLLWLSPDNKTVLKDTRPARNHAPITGDISTEDLPDLLVATHLALTTAGKLSRPSHQLLHHLCDQLHVY